MIVIRYLHGISDNYSRSDAKAIEKIVSDYWYGVGIRDIDFKVVIYDDVFERGWKAHFRRLLASKALWFSSDLRQFAGGSVGDVFDFFLDEDCRKKIRKIVFEELKQSGPETHLIGYSLGSLVAAHTLGRYGITVDSLSFIGSPFGSRIPAIRSGCRRFFGYELIEAKKLAGSVFNIIGEYDPLSGPLDDAWGASVTQQRIPATHTDHRAYLRAALARIQTLEGLKNA